jgi:hypothetical protein
MPFSQRRETGNILVPDFFSPPAEVVQGRIHVPGIPQNQGVDYQSERASWSS